MDRRRTRGSAGCAAGSARVGHRRGGRGRRRGRDRVPPRGRGVRRQHRPDGRLCGVRRRAGVRPRPQAPRAHVRAGLGHPAGRRDRREGHGQGRGGQQGAGQRRRRRIGRVRHPARQAPRGPRHRCRQRPQAGLHAIARCRRGGRLPRHRLHTHVRSVRRDPRPGRPPIGLRLPTGPRPRRHLPLRRRQCAFAPPRADGRVGRGPRHRPLDRRARGAAGPCPLRARGGPLRQRRHQHPRRPRRSASTRSPPLWHATARAAPSARSSSRRARSNA